MSNPKLIKMRKLMKEQQIDGYIVRSTDAHNSEYQAICDKRLKYITGFSGSNGLAFITQEEALMWTDSRYYIQAQKELEKGWEMRKQEVGIQSWYEIIKEKHPQNTRIGFNPLFMNNLIYGILLNTWKEKQIVPWQLEKDLVDEIWEEKPGMPTGEVFIHGVEFCGKSVEEKVLELGKKLEEEKKGNGIFFTAALDEIAWLLNLRCNDIDYNPYFFSYLLLQFQSPQQYTGTLYILESKISTQVKDYLTKFNIGIKNYFQVFDDLKLIKQKIILDKNLCNLKVLSSIDQELIVHMVSPIQLMKAVKNQREQQGMIECHIRDGVGLVSYLAWLEDQIVNQKNTKISEYDGAMKVKEFREEQKWNKGLAFGTISSIGANGASVHYQASENQSSLINDQEIYLLDSGAQYLDGTTDVTRSLHFSTPTAEQKDSYTRVLLGNLSIERTIWPRKWKINGSDLDVLARWKLWQEHKDFGHGTGHGVGYFLGVHEGPCGISKRVGQPFVDGMVVSNEPGYYKENCYGIRIENCLMVVPDENDANFQAFRNLTLCPYDRKLMDFSLLNKDDIKYINSYHTKVREILEPLLKEQGKSLALDWLIKETLPL